MFTISGRLRRPRDRILSTIRDIKNTLKRLSAKATVRVVLLSPQKIQFCEQEIQTAVIDGVEFTILFDIAELFKSGATFDVATDGDVGRHRTLWRRRVWILTGTMKGPEMGEGATVLGDPFSTKECSAASYSPTSSRLQYHRRWQA